MNANDFAQIALAVFRVVLTVLSVVLMSVVLPWLRNVAVPWLKEHRMFELVTHLVEGAEKYFDDVESAGEDKKRYVVSVLNSKGIEITPEIEAYIESAVREVEFFKRIASHDVANVFTGDDMPDENDDVEITDIVDGEPYSATAGENTADD